MIIDQGGPSSGPSKWSPEVTVVLLNIVHDSVFKNIIPDVQMEVISYLYLLFWQLSVV